MPPCPPSQTTNPSLSILVPAGFLQSSTLLYFTLQVLAQIHRLTLLLSWCLTVAGSYLMGFRGLAPDVRTVTVCYLGLASNTCMLPSIYTIGGAARTPMYWSWLAAQNALACGVVAALRYKHEGNELIVSIACACNMVCFVTAGSASAVQTFLNQGEAHFEVMSLATMALVPVVSVSAAYTCYRAWSLYQDYCVSSSSRFHRAKNA